MLEYSNCCGYKTGKIGFDKTNIHETELLEKFDWILSKVGDINKNKINNWLVIEIISIAKSM